MPSTSASSSHELSPLIDKPDTLNSRWSHFRSEHRRAISLVGYSYMLLAIGGTLALSIYMDSLHQNENRLLNFLLHSIGSIIDKNNGNHSIPRSFYVTPNFWLYVCQQLENCDLNTTTGLTQQTERILATHGANIYDAACYMIAMALNNKFDDAQYQLDYLLTGRTADANPNSTLRATSNSAKAPNQTFTYGVTHTYITDPRNAYFFRMNAAHFINSDPLAGWSSIPANASQEWVDWKPITGENAWATLIAPLQFTYLKYGRNLAAIPGISVNSALRLALSMSYTFEIMQSPIGAIYYTTTDVAPNNSDGEVNPYSVSLENNFSALAGLHMLRQILAKQYIFDKEVKRLDQMINAILEFIRVYAFDKEAGYFVQGGLANDPNQASDWVPTKQPFAVDVQTWGMTVLGQPQIDNWFGNGTAFAIWQKVKEQAGYYDTPMSSFGGVGYSNQPAPITTPTINVTVTNFDGDNKQQHSLRAFALWSDNATATQLTASPIAYNNTAVVVVPMQSQSNSSLSALQFIDENNVEVAKLPVAGFNDQSVIKVSWQQTQVTITRYAPRHDILSAEWTFGAINMARALAEQYRLAGNENFSAILQYDSTVMKRHVSELSTDNFAGIPETARVTLPSDQIAYLYANKHYAIPFGWNAEPIPSSTSSSWAIFELFSYNPFQLGGSFAAIDWTNQGTPSAAIRSSQNPFSMFQPSRTGSFSGNETASLLFLFWMFTVLKLGYQSLFRDTADSADSEYQYPQMKAS